MRTDVSFLRGETITCAVSGGGDSVALLHLLWSKREELELNLSAAHYHHGLRETADRDEAFVRALCQRWQIPLMVGRGDVNAYAIQNGMSVEEAARTLRYDFLLAQPGMIALAHNADDQVETVLLNLLRGTGLKGLGGMETQRDRLVRPLLQVTRAEIEGYLAEHGLSYCTDETNGKDDALRNRLRHHVVPLLRQENPALTQTVGRMSRLLQQDEAYLQAETEKLLEKAKTNGGYDCRILNGSPLRDRAIRALLTIAKPAMSHVQAVAELMETLEGSKEIHLPSMTVRREYGIVYFGKAHSCETPAAVTVSRLEQGSVLWGNWNIAWQAGDGTLCIRKRQSGDTIKLPGGTKTVKKLLIDRKIPAKMRDTLPVVTCGGEVVAVGNVAANAAWIRIEERKI